MHIPYVVKPAAVGYWTKDDLVTFTARTGPAAERDTVVLGIPRAMLIDLARHIDVGRDAFPSALAQWRDVLGAHVEPEHGS